MTRHAQYHLHHDAGNGKLDNWPNGCWAVYRITGDEIAKRAVFAANGEVCRRDPWPGYLGMCETLAEAMELIEADRASLREAA